MAFYYLNSGHLVCNGNQTVSNNWTICKLDMFRWFKYWASPLFGAPFFFFQFFCLFPFFASACKISLDKNDLALENLGIDESVLKYVFQNKFIEAHADAKKVCARTYEGMYKLKKIFP